MYPCNAYNVNLDSGDWVLILVVFWVLKVAFQWGMMQIKMGFCQFLISGFLYIYASLHVSV